MNKAKYFRSIILSGLFILGLLQAGYCQAAGNEVITIATSGSTNLLQQTIPDGKGGAFLTWIRDVHGNGSDYDVYAQAIDSCGNAKWTANGVAVCTTAGIQTSVRMIGDNNGGIILSWQDYRNIVSNPAQGSDIYAQAIDSAGNVKWINGGIAVCTASSSQSAVDIAADGQNGAIITWSDNRQKGHIYAQAVGSTGTIKWAENGISVSQSTTSQNSPHIISNGQGGAVIAWFDYRCGLSSYRYGEYYDLYAQSIDSNGNIKWNSSDVAVCTALIYQFDPQMISDGQGGAIIAWTNGINGVYGGNRIRIQSIDSTGNIRWIQNGLTLCTTGHD